MLAFFCFASLFFSNPFAIDIPLTPNPTKEDLSRAQQALRRINIEETIHKLYPLEWEKEGRLLTKHHYGRDDFILRCSRCLQQVLFCVEPITVFSEGVDKKRCVVLFSSCNGPYPDMIEELQIGLREVGFQGGIYYRIGGYPSPQGDELKFAGVPYAFKLFMIQEAFQKGFEQVLWLDSASWPLGSIDDLFDEIKKEGFLFDWGKPNPFGILPQASQIIQEYTGKDITKERKVAGWIMGMSALDSRTTKILQDYRHLVELGVPFLSVNPEEYVITSVLLKNGVLPKIKKSLMITCTNNNNSYIDALKKGCKFIIRAH